jgi:cell division septation protein DedD
MRRRKVSFSSDPRWTAMKRAGLAIALALVLLIVMLWFGDSNQPPPPLPESVNAVPIQSPSGTPAPQADTPVLPEPDTTAQTDTEPTVAPAPATEETGNMPETTPGLDVAVTNPVTAAPPLPSRAATKSPKVTSAPTSSPKVASAPSASTSLPDGYFIQLGVFDDTENVSRLLNNVTELGLPAHIQSRVMVGPFSNKREAEEARSRLKEFAEGTVLPPQKTAKASEKPKAKSKQRQRAR